MIGKHGLCLLLSLPTAFSIFQSSLGLKASSEYNEARELESQLESSEYTPQAWFCVDWFECTHEKNLATQTYEVKPVDTLEKCAKECSWTKGCKTFSFNNRRTHGKQCRISKCVDGTHENCGKSWAMVEQAFTRKFGASDGKEYVKEAMQSGGCTVELGKFEAIKLCYMPTFKAPLNFGLIKISSGWQCKKNYKVMDKTLDMENKEVAIDSPYHCRNECGKRLGCRVFTWNEKKKDCRISACGRAGDADTKGPDKLNKKGEIKEQFGCGDLEGVGIPQALDKVDEAGSCKMEEKEGSDVYRIKYYKGGELMDVNFGACQGVERTLGEMITEEKYYKGGAASTFDLKVLPAYLYGGKMYTRLSPDCVYNELTPNITFSFRTGIKVYVIVQGKMPELKEKFGYVAERVDTGEEQFHVLHGEENTPISVYSKYMVEGSSEKIPFLTSEQWTNIIAIASQSADVVQPGPILPGLIRVSGGNTSWNKPRLFHEDMLTQPGDLGWNNTFFREVPQALINGLYIGNHLTNYVDEGHKTVTQWPGQNLADGPLWDLNIHYLAPTRICLLVWDQNNKINGVMTKKYDARLPRKLVRKYGFSSPGSSCYRTDGPWDSKFHFKQYCKTMEDDPMKRGEQVLTIKKLNGTLIAGFFSYSPMPGSIPTEEQVEANARAIENENQAPEENDD